LVQVRDHATAAPIVGALVLLEVEGGRTFSVQANAGGDAWCWPVPMNTGVVVTVTADGYHAYDHQRYGGFGLDNNNLPIGLTLAKPALPPRPPYQPRAPLPPMPPGSYDRTLPFTPPVGPSRDFYRGDFCGVRVPGIPLLPEMSGFTVDGWRDNRVGGLNPPIMALDIPRYWKVSRDLVIENLNAHAIRGYTHLQCSAGHALEQGLSIDDYVEYSKLVQAIVGFADHWFLGGGPWSARDKNGNWTEARDRDRAYWAPILNPWIDALLANQAIDCACVGWQLDGGNKENEPIQSIIDYFADRLRPHDIPIGTHWLNEAGAWNFPMDRFKWWQSQRGKLRWFHHQGDVNMDIPLYQAKLVDTLQPFGDGRMGAPGEFALVIYECSAQAQFDLQMSEDVGNQRGFLLCCTAASSHVGGYGNGARRPDGSVL
jgi:hypothetical protein